MKVYHSINAFQAPDWPVITIGTFDGVHIGHRKIIDQVNSLARKRKGESVVLTFHPHPRMVLHSDLNIKLINTLDERLKLLEEAGVDHCVVHPFSHEFSRLSAKDYVRDILVSQLNVRSLVIGYDHHFGRNRSGSFDLLKEYGSLYEFELEEIPPQVYGDINVSSTKIRQSLKEGNVKKANSFLGSNFTISGKVVQGDQVGRTLGFPTANLDLNNENKLIPSDGVYAVRVLLGQVSMMGMMNLGERPTIGGRKRTIEVHILNFEGDIYGQKLKLEFLDFIREEKKFSSKEELIAQIQEDKDEVLSRSYH